MASARWDADPAARVAFQAGPQTSAQKLVACTRTSGGPEPGHSSAPRRSSSSSPPRAVMVRAVTESISAKESNAEGAGPAAGVRWDLSDLYGGAADAAIDAGPDPAPGHAPSLPARSR